MKSLLVLVAVFGVFALVSENASATSDSSSFLVSLRIAAPCDVSSSAASAAGGVTVRCESASTPYRLEMGAREVQPPQAREAAAGESEGYTRATITF